MHREYDYMLMMASEDGQRVNAYVGQHAVAIRAAITYFGG